MVLRDPSCKEDEAVLVQDQAWLKSRQARSLPSKAGTLFDIVFLTWSVLS